MGPTTPATAPRRTQAERREATRNALLSAAIDQLVDHGLASFTTTEVCKRAGVSQGALFKHFDSKAALLAAVVEQLFDNLRADYEVAFVDLGESTDLRLAVDLLWARMLDPRLAAGFELYTAARSDADLAASLDPVVEAHCARIHELAAGLLPDIAPERLTPLVDLVILSIQGLVLNQMARPDLEQVDRLRDMLDRLLDVAL